MLNKLKTQLKEQLDTLVEQLPTNIQTNKLHKALGLDPDVDLNDLKVDDITTKQISAVNAKKATYKDMIAMLNWQAVMNKTKNPDFTKKLRQVMANLKDKFSTVNASKEVPEEKKNIVDKVIESVNQNIYTVEDILKKEPSMKDKINFMYEMNMSKISENAIKQITEGHNVVIQIKENGDIDQVKESEFDPSSMVYFDKISKDELN